MNTYEKIKNRRKESPASARHKDSKRGKRHTHSGRFVEADRKVAQIAK